MSTLIRLDMCEGAEMFKTCESFKNVRVCFKKRKCCGLLKNLLL